MVTLADRPGGRQHHPKVRGHARFTRQQADQARLYAEDARSAADEARRTSADIVAKLQHLNALAVILEDEVKNLRDMGRTLRNRFR
jgi:CO/xanthine dehydrogenase Mo-binding subunit